MYHVAVILPREIGSGVMSFMEKHDAEAFIANMLTDDPTVVCHYVDTESARGLIHD